MKRIDERKAPVMILWIAVLAIGLLVIAEGYMDLQKETRDIEALFETHVESVVLLVNESTRETTAATSLLYEIAEEHLLTVAELMKDAAGNDPDIWPHLKTAHRMAVWISSDDNSRFSGDWGAVPISQRADIVDWMKSADKAFLIDDGPLRALSLACIRLVRKSNTEEIVCRDANVLMRHRKDIGIGPLLRGVTQKDIRYVALQDAGGILAVSPSPTLLSDFEEDPFLVSALDRPEGAPSLFRTRTVDEKTIFEGVVPFKLADESLVLLRIGIDGERLLEVKQNAISRFVITVGWTAAGIFLATLLFIFLKRWQRKRIELKQRIEKEAAARRHWEDIGRMAATVAHEVRNPLNTIGMISQRLRSEFAIATEEKEAFDEMVQLLMSEGKRVEKVVTDFLALGKPLKLECRLHDSGDLVEESLLRLTMRAQKENKHLELTHCTDAKIFVDAKRFGQMLTNLIENGLDAVEEEGRVTVACIDKNDRVDIHISDNGSGLSDDKLATVFMPFVSYKSNGNGLGLPLVKRMAEAHGGEVSLSPNAGAGLTATLSLPKRMTS